MAKYTWDPSKPCHRQPIYVAAREALKTGPILLGWTQTGEIKVIARGRTDLLRTHTSVMAQLGEFADTLTLMDPPSPLST